MSGLKTGSGPGLANRVRVVRMWRLKKTKLGWATGAAGPVTRHWTPTRQRLTSALLQLLGPGNELMETKKKIKNKSKTLISSSEDLDISSFPLSRNPRSSSPSWLELPLLQSSSSPPRTSTSCSVVPFSFPSASSRVSTAQLLRSTASA